MTAHTNGHLQKATVDALARTLAENRELRTMVNVQPQQRAPFRHCGFCGGEVCTCGLEGYQE